MVKQHRLIWAWLTVNRAELGAILAIGLVAVLMLFAVHLRFQPAASSTSFGPGWECTPVPNGEPICVKKVGPSSPDPK